MQHLVQRAPRARLPADVPSVTQARRIGPETSGGLNNGAGVHALTQLHGMLNRRPAVVAQMRLAHDLSRRALDLQPSAPIQRANLTGLPDQLKAGTENLSGLSLDDVEVHYNSAEPATLQAAAYARGSDIHIGPGQEQHLPHEAWHVVQQKQGRVRPTIQAKGVAINDDQGLESEADTMGAQALRHSGSGATMPPAQAKSSALERAGAVQLQPILSDHDMREIIRQAAFRHGDAEAGQIDQAFRAAAALGPVDLPVLLDQLDGGTKAERRTAHLLRLTLNDLESGSERAQDSWNAFDAIADFIMTYGSTFNQERQGNSISDIYSLLGANHSSWQAAAIAALRAGALDGTGFQYLSDILFTLTHKVLLDYKAPDVQHEIALQNALPDQDNGRTGTAMHPDYAGLGPNGSIAHKTGYLNAKSSGFSKLMQSGAYKQDGSLITKTLDLGHTAVDRYENVAHRNKTTVAPDTPFNYLALLSPNDRQQAVGTNGAVLGDGSYMFVVDRNFRFRYMPAANYVGEGGTAKNFVQFIPHSQLAGRADVLGAGNFFIEKGHFIWIDNGSGHYRVDAALNEANVSASLRALGYKIAGIRFLSRGGGDLDATYAAGNQILDPFHSGRPDATYEIRAMEDAMHRLGPRINRSTTSHNNGQPQQIEIEMTNIPIELQRQPQVPQGVVIDQVFGQNQDLTGHIGNDQL